MSQPYPSTQPSESTMVAHHTERNGRLPRRAAYHARTSPYGQHGPHLTPHPLVKPRGQQTKTRWPITKWKAPSQKKATLDASHGRVPGTANTRRTLW